MEADTYVLTYLGRTPGRRKSSMHTPSHSVLTLYFVLPRVSVLVCGLRLTPALQALSPPHTPR